MKSKFSYSLLPMAVEVMDEDGPRIVDVYYVTATLPSGRRWVHYHAWKTSLLAEAYLAKVALRGHRGPTPPLAYWNEMDPVYGSEYYEKSGGDTTHHVDIEPSLNLRLTEAQKHVAQLDYDNR